MTPIDRAVAAAIAELHHQAERSGCATGDNGASVQIDGSFKMRPVVLAIVASLREPDETTLQAGEEIADEYSPGTPVDLTWKSMIDALLRDRA